jgi:hypothetical protein
VGILEWFALHLPSWMVNLFKAWFGRPRPDVRILTLERTGGSHPHVDFQAELVNCGTQACRATLAADVNGEPVTCSPATVDLQPNQPPKPVQVYVQRPALGNLVKALRHAPIAGQRLLEEAGRAGVDGDDPRPGDRPRPLRRADGGMAGLPAGTWLEERLALQVGLI